MTPSQTDRLFAFPLYWPKMYRSIPRLKNELTDGESQRSVRGPDRAGGSPMENFCTALTKQTAEPRNVEAEITRLPPSTCCTNPVVVTTPSKSIIFVLPGGVCEYWIYTHACMHGYISAAPLSLAPANQRHLFLSPSNPRIVQQRCLVYLPRN